MDVLTMAKELGNAIQMDDTYINFKIAEQNVACDETLQSIISKFNEKKSEINQEITKEKMDQNKVNKLNSEIGEIYAEINENPTMQTHNKLSRELQKLMTKINFILSKSAAGEDPQFINPDEFAGDSCNGSCSSCGGC